jgi:hypothetical protein
VERFMRDYYRTRAIKTYRAVIDQCARRVDRAGEDADVTVVEHGFRIVNDQLMIPTAHLREGRCASSRLPRRPKHQVPLSRMAQRLVRENRPSSARRSARRPPRRCSWTSSTPRPG